MIIVIVLKWVELGCECADKNQINVDIPTKIGQPIHMRISWLFALLFSVLYSNREPVMHQQALFIVVNHQLVA